MNVAAAISQELCFEVPGHDGRGTEKELSIARAK
jgi:hypothetical protein